VDGMNGGGGSVLQGLRVPLADSRAAAARKRQQLLCCVLIMVVLPSGILSAERGELPRLTVYTWY
jgi:hypothetical protein